MRASLWNIGMQREKNLLKSDSPDRLPLALKSFLGLKQGKNNCAGALRSCDDIRREGTEITQRGEKNQGRRNATGQGEPSKVEGEGQGRVQLRWKKTGGVGWGGVGGLGPMLFSPCSQGQRGGWTKTSHNVREYRETGDRKSTRSAFRWSV